MAAPGPCLGADLLRATPATTGAGQRRIAAIAVSAEFGVFGERPCPARRNGRRNPGPGHRLVALWWQHSGGAWPAVRFTLAGSGPAFPGFAGAIPLEPVAAQDSPLAGTRAGPGQKEQPAARLPPLERSRTPRPHPQTLRLSGTRCQPRRPAHFAVTAIGGGEGLVLGGKQLIQCI